MSKTTLPHWFDKLKLDQELDAYKCKYQLAGTSIDIFLFVEDRKVGSRQKLAIAAERLLAQWPIQQDQIVRDLRKELKKESRLKRQNESAVSKNTIVLFSLSVFQNEGEDYYSYGINIPGLLEDDEYIDYSRDVAHTWTTIDVASTED